MRHLILMRHAEAGYAAPGDKDFDRPLTQSGAKESRSQARVLEETRLVPDLVLCSPAKRTHDTWNGLQSGLAELLAIDFELQMPDSLYQATPDTILKMARAIPEQVDIALIVAHNPGIHEAALALAQPVNGQACSDLAVDLQGGFPPASMAVFECKIRGWQDVSHETATLRQLIRAR